MIIINRETINKEITNCETTNVETTNRNATNQETINTETTDGKEIRVRVVGQERGIYRISNGERDMLAEVSGKFRYEATLISDFPAVGDYVVASWPTDGSNAIISSLFPRKSSFVRKAAGTGNQDQVVSANVDVIFICMSLNQDFNVRRIERYVSVAWNSGATPVVVLTKADLCEDVEQKVEEVSEVAIGVDVLTVSSLEDDFGAVSDMLKPEKTYAFIGSSGVGKSTLINRLIGEEVIATSEIREDDDKGRHTTTHRELITLPNGSYVIDTPGMRELGLWDSEEGIDTTFSDIEELIPFCRFSDCSHESEPGCAIMKALEDGSLSRDRWNSYLKLKTENAYMAGTEDYLRAKREKFRKIAKINRGKK